MWISLFLFGLLGQSIPSTQIHTQPIQLNQKEQSQLQEIQRSFSILNLQLEMLRHDVCWRQGIKVEECGGWDAQGRIIRVPLANESKEPAKSKETKEK
jgi:hypothetical protein